MKVMSALNMKTVVCVASIFALVGCVGGSNQPDSANDPQVQPLMMVDQHGTLVLVPAGYILDKDGKLIPLDPKNPATPPVQQGSIGTNPDDTKIPEAATPVAKPKPKPAPTNIAPTWHALRTRLLASGFSAKQIDPMLASFDADISQIPMAVKVKELYTYKYLRSAAPTTPVDPNKPVKPRPRYYANVVNEKNAQVCLAFIKEHEPALLKMEEKWKVPIPIATALLFVETRLGTQTGTHFAALNLASMASVSSHKDIITHVKKLDGSEEQERLDWIDKRIEDKANWAYSELVALIKYANAIDCNPAELKGSVYGAVGWCQFMPSNVPVYGADGSGDGIIDLNNPEDAIASLARYLSEHRWAQQATTREGQHKVLMRYNRSTMYANTILALADLIEEARKTDTAKSVASR